MNDDSFRTLAAVSAIAALPVAAGNLLTILLVARFDVQAISDPLLLLHAGAGAAEVWRWSMLLDMFGYYLMIVPLILLLHARLHSRSPLWVDLAALCLVSYCLVGAIGTAVMATASPRLMLSYPAADAIQRSILKAAAVSYADSIYRGLWNLLEELFATVGWIVLGTTIGTERRGLSRLTIVLGIACLVDAFGTSIGVDAISIAGLTAYLVLAPVWAFWTGSMFLSHEGRLALDAVQQSKP